MSTCPRCHSQFEHRAGVRRSAFCSATCRNTFRKYGPKPKAGRTCKRCGADVPAGKRLGTEFCTKRCYQAAHSESAGPEARRDAYLRREYGLSSADVDARVMEQGGCAVCGRGEPDDRGWQVDHDHACCPGKRSCGRCVRGVLCRPCNTALGLLRDSPDVALSAAAYMIQRVDVLSAAGAR